MYEVAVYETENGRCQFRDYLHKLAKQKKQNEITKINTYIDWLAQDGMSINNCHHHAIRPIGDGVYELRPGQHRVFFFGFTGSKFVLLHAYTKAGKKAPSSQINQAIQEMKDYIRRHPK